MRDLNNFSSLTHSFRFRTAMTGARAEFERDGMELIESAMS
jgi:hypothetical protein